MTTRNRTMARLLVLRHLLEQEESYGLLISHTLNLGHPTVYQVLGRLRADGWTAERYERGIHGTRIWVRLTTFGRSRARAEFVAARRDRARLVDRLAILDAVLMPDGGQPARTRLR